jgi:hypothetical protein
MNILTDHQLENNPSRLWVQLIRAGLFKDITCWRIKYRNSVASCLLKILVIWQFLLAACSFLKTDFWLEMEMGWLCFYTKWG